MSLPNTGSTTGLAPAGAYGTRFSQRRIVCQSPAIEPAIVSAMRTATTAMIPRPSEVGSGMSPGVTSMAAPRRRVGFSQGAPRAPRASWVRSAASLRRSISVRSVPPSPLAGGRSRPASQRLPSSTSRTRTPPNTNSPTCTQSRRQKTAS